MNRKQQEILDLIQEECAEVIQAISKVRRFGKEDNIEELCTEISDVLYLVKLAQLNIDELYNFNYGIAESKKFEKLSKFSNIFQPV
jgi:NTP pyrophosphatase (non-canonical NTP hydrolase)